MYLSEFMDCLCNIWKQLREHINLIRQSVNCFNIIRYQGAHSTALVVFNTGEFPAIVSSRGIVVMI